MKVGHHGFEIWDLSFLEVKHHSHNKQEVASGVVCLVMARNRSFWPSFCMWYQSHHSHVLISPTGLEPYQVVASHWSQSLLYPLPNSILFSFIHPFTISRQSYHSDCVRIWACIYRCLTKRTPRNWPGLELKLLGQWKIMKDCHSFVGLNSMCWSVSPYQLKGMFWVPSSLVMVCLYGYLAELASLFWLDQSKVGHEMDIYPYDIITSNLERK